jgi:hypothetical protein
VLKAAAEGCPVGFPHRQAILYLPPPLSLSAAVFYFCVHTLSQDCGGRSVEQQREREREREIERGKERVRVRERERERDRKR